MKPGARILLATENAEARSFASDALHAANCQVTLASSPSDLLCCLASLRPDVVVLDSMFGGESCSEFLSNCLLNQAQDGPAWLVLASQDTGAEERIAFFEAGAADFISQPVTPREFLARVRRLKRPTEASAASTEPGLLRLCLEAAHMVTWDWDATTDRIRYSDNVRSELGGVAETTLGTLSALLAAVHPTDRPRVEANLDRAFRQGTPFEGRFRLRLADGQNYWIYARGEVKRDANGNLARMMGVSLDVTDRNRVEEALQRSDAYFRALLENAVDVTAVIDASGRIAYASPSVQSVLGYPAAQLEGRNVLDLVHPDEASEAREVLTEISKRNGPGPVRRYRIHHRDGSWRVLEVRGKSQVDDPAVQGIILNASDVTERVRAEELLREAEMRYRNLVENVPVVSWVTDDHGHTSYISSNVESVLGYTAEEVCRAGPSLFLGNIHPGDSERVNVEYGALFASREYDTEYRVRHKAGHWIWVHDRATTVVEKDGRKHAYGVFTDISSRKQEELALLNATEQLNHLLRCNPASIYAAQPEPPYSCLYISENVRDWLGYEPADFMHGQDFWMRNIHPDDLHVVERSMEQLHRSGEAAYEYRFRHRDGTYRWMLDHCKLVRDASGRLLDVVGFWIDVTARRTAEEALANKEKLYRSLFDFSPSGILLEDFEGRILDANEAVCSASGYTREELLGQNVRLFAPPDMVGAVEENLAALAAGKTLEHEVVCMRKDGSLRVRRLCETGIPLPDGRRGILAMAEDITERKQAEEQLRRSEALLKAQFEHSPDIILIIDREFRFVTINRTCAGPHTPQDLVGLDSIAVLPASEQAPVRSAIEKVFATGELQEIEHGIGDGKWVRARIVPMWMDGAVANVMAISTDITERRRSEAMQALHRELGSRLTPVTALPDLLEILLEMAVRLEGADCGGVYLVTAANELELAAHRGLSAGFVNQVAHFAADSPQMLLAKRGKAVFMDSPKLERALPPDALVHIRETEGMQSLAVVPLHYEGALVGVLNLGSHRNQEFPAVTRAFVGTFAALAASAIARVRAENALRDSEALLRAFFDSPGACRGIVELVDGDLMVTSANPLLAALLGSTPSEVRGRRFGESAAMRPALRVWTENCRECQATSKSQTFEQQLTLENGESRWFLVTLSFLGHSAETLPRFALLALDVTERHEAEAVVRALPRRIVEAQEAERQRVARDLHDGVNQLLLSVKFRLHPMQDHGSELKPHGRETVARCCELLSQAVEETMRIAHNLRPRDLDDLGLSAACRNLCDDFQRRTGIIVEAEFGTVTQRLEPFLELHLFRIVQEGFSNVAKHSGARRVRLGVLARGENIELKIEDDGQGFHAGAPRAEPAGTSGLGLLNLRDRAAAMGGTCEVQSVAGRGTRIRVLVPLAKRP